MVSFLKKNIENLELAFPCKTIFKIQSKDLLKLPTQYYNFSRVNKSPLRKNNSKITQQLN